MKKKLALILATALLIVMFTACMSETPEEEQTEPNNNNLQANEQADDPVNEDLLQELDCSFASTGMPVPFENTGGDENWHFYMRYLSRFSAFSGMITDEIARQMEWTSTNKEFDEAVREMWGYGGWDPQSGVMDFPSLLWYIIEFDVPDEVIVYAIEKYNEWMFSFVHENTYMPGFLLSIFTEEDIAALLTRDPAIVTAQFAEETAIVIDDRAFTPAWLYIHTPDEWREAGITMEMVEEKLDVYSQFPFVLEAEVAFAEKLSEFMEEEVSLAREQQAVESDELVVADS